MELDHRAYLTFKKLKQKYSVKTILITPQDTAVTGLRALYPTHRDYIAHRFSQIGIEITRWSTNYKTLDGSNPELGLIYLANDSVIVPGQEVHALLDHNCRYMNAQVLDV